MYDEDDVDSIGEGVVLDEIRNSINYQGYNEVAIFGYSHGGGSVYDLASAIEFYSGIFVDPDFRIIEPFSIVFTSYIDAITNETAFAENRRPPLSQYHQNQYQTNVGFQGGPTTNLEFLDEEEERSSPGQSHGTIDDDPVVLDFLKLRLRQLVTR
jgi:hypothetical protein